MATRYDCADTDAVGLCRCDCHCVSSIPLRRRFADASGPGVAPRLSARHGFMGSGRRSQTRPTTLLRLRFVCLFCLAYHSACLSLSDQRHASVLNLALLCWYLPCCYARCLG